MALGSSIDHREGYAFIKSGETWYSPNGWAVPDIPLTDFKFNHETRLADVKVPQWWTQEYAWLPWIPKDPFQGALHYLNSFTIERLSGRQSGYRLKSTTLSQWADLADHLDAMGVPFTIENSNMLERHVLFPPHPSNTNFRDIHRTHKAAMFHCHKAQEFFTLWLGFLAYQINVGFTDLDEKIGH